MTFVWLEHGFHDKALLQDIGEPCDMTGIEQVDLEEMPIPHMVPIERDAFDQRYSCNKFLITIVPPKTDSKRVIDRKMKSMDINIY